MDAREIILIVELCHLVVAVLDLIMPGLPSDRSVIALWEVDLEPRLPHDRVAAHRKHTLTAPLAPPRVTLRPSSSATDSGWAALPDRRASDKGAACDPGFDVDVNSAEGSKTDYAFLRPPLGG